MSRTTIEDLARQYEAERYYGDDRAAAEFAYALAVRLRELGDIRKARRYATECLSLARLLSARSLDDVASQHAMVGGVPIPERFHDGVVRARLSSLLVDHHQTV